MDIILVQAIVIDDKSVFALYIEDECLSVNLNHKKKKTKQEIQKKMNVQTTY